MTSFLVLHVVPDEHIVLPVLHVVNYEVQVFWIFIVFMYYTIVRQVLHCLLGGDKLSSIHELLFKLRKQKDFSLREAARRSGLSHSYIDSLEKGYHPKTKSPVKPSPESLKSLAAAYNYDYILLMNAAGYVQEDAESNDYKPLPENEINRIIKEAEEQYGVNLRDDPDVNSALRELIHSLAKMKRK